jgi:protocatechuate 3,4-dioxygenase beta subunit
MERKQFLKTLGMSSLLVPLVMSCGNEGVTPSLSVTSFSPGSGAEGVSVTITGTSFSTTLANNVVSINGVSATVTSATATQLVVTVPANATSGVISVTVNGITVTSASSFTVNTSVVSTSCTSTSSETAGPFPTKSPSTLIATDIRSDRTGVPFTIEITIQNKNNSCAPLEGAFVDIWHCDKDGYYSEYGGTSMQTVDFTAVHFLRGRQTTNSSGQVGFTSVFPGWYQSRATHIHVHIYNSSGNSLLVTQIAFPEGTNSAVTLVNASTANGYTKGMNGYTTNASDSVFSDSVANELATVTGSIADGYKLTHTIVVSA